MTDKTEAQSEALELADRLIGNAQIDECEGCNPVVVDLERSAAAELRRQYSEIQQLKAQLTTQTNRAAAAEQQVTALTQRLDMANRLNTDARNQLAQLSARQAAPDGWRLVPVEPTLNMLDTAFGICDKNGRPVPLLKEAAASQYSAMLSAAPPPPEREPLTELQKQALAVYLPPFQFSHGYVFDSAGRMVADEGRDNELDQLASTVGVRIRGWGHLGKLKNGAEVQDTIGELAAAALNAYWKQHGIGATK
ncbi:hypothetical protein [Comamonas sp.]|uniref:hypothetical protein n=1 Tax=Comamonas sp. TaxID=34028 RepID=UPI0028AC6ABF|nr:hypothetical protein [Comamonas sp.]